MLKLAPFLAVILFAATTLVHAGEKQKAFDYNTQIGIAEVTETGDGCLTISNALLREKQSVKLIILGQPQKVEERKIRKKLNASCSRNTETPPDASFYAFTAGKEQFDPSIAVVGLNGDFKAVKGKIRIDLNGDGSAESFRSCTSNEGLHLTVWFGEALKTKRLWHEYYYLGFDVEPSCKPADYKD